MAQQTQTCGKTTVKYDERCTYTCSCGPKIGGCEWNVECPDGKGGWINTSGTGMTTTQPKYPTVRVAGNLGAIARCLTKMWKLKVTAPERLAAKRVKRTLKGSHEEIAQALGLKLG